VVGFFSVSAINAAKAAIFKFSLSVLDWASILL
jgi:hypothetical protein